MKSLTVKDIIKVTKGILIQGDENFQCENFSRDTREIKKDDTFIGIKGENFDGNLLWQEALNNGAKVIIVQGIDFEQENLEKYKDKIIIKVQNTRKALIEIATLKRQIYGKDLKVIGVTGSVGKTSTKDIIANVLSKKYKTLKTEGNNNNAVGLPFTILRLKDEQVAVIEMGMNHFGEIDELTKIAKPDLAVITNIGTSHIGNLGSRENILKAKLEILNSMQKPAVIINNDNDLLHKWKEENSQNKNIQIKTFGIKNISDIMASDIILKENSSNFNLKLENKKINITIPVAGEHFILNSLCAALVGKTLGLSNEQIQEGIETFTLTKKRMDIKNLENGITIINDAYNASFESMKAALENLSRYKNNRKIAVLGDMFELGKFEEELHKKVGKEVQKNGIDFLICMGERSKNIVNSSIECGMEKSKTIFCKNEEEIINILKEKLQKGDVVLFKASNGMRFYEIANNLIKLYSK